MLGRAMAVVLLLGAAGALRAQEAPPADDRYVFAADGGHEARVSFDATADGRELPLAGGAGRLGHGAARRAGRRATRRAVRVELRAGTARRAPTTSTRRRAACAG